MKLMSLQSKFFPTVKAEKIDGKTPLDHDDVNNLINQINQRFGSMKVKIVVGQKLFKRKHLEIKTMIENSSHFRYGWEKNL